MSAQMIGLGRHTLALICHPTLFPFTCLVLVLLFLKLIFAARNAACPPARGCTVVGFFHPHAAAGGGGERVLWVAIAALARAARARGGRPLRILVFTGDLGVPPARIVADAAARFGVALPPLEGGAPASSAAAATLRFVYIRSRPLLDAALYPRLTLLGQALGAAACALECVARAAVHVWVDTTGAAFGFPVARWLGGAAVAAYVHYPTVSTDMIGVVASRAAAFNNAPAIARSGALTAAKVAYYRAFAAAYGAAGRCAAPGGVMVNSSWTAGHIRALWRPDAAVVFPPCPTAALARLPPGGARARERLVVSLAQFRPEKDHALQLRAFAAFAARRPRAFADVRLRVMGGARGAEDEARLAALRALAAQLGLARRVDFVVNAPMGEVHAALGRALAGLHTMRAEHFGISVVEMQAAGVVVVAHDSGGPAADIVAPAWRAGGGGASGAGAPPLGCLASTEEEYADALEAIFSGGIDCERVAAAARGACARFSDEAFEEGFVGALAPLLGWAAGGAPSLRARQAGGKRRGSAAVLK